MMDYWNRVDVERNRITDWIHKTQFKASHLFEPRQIEYTINDIKLIAEESGYPLVNAHNLPYYNAMWFIEHDLSRSVILRIDKIIMIDFKVPSVPGLCTMEHFQCAFGGDGVCKDSMLRKLAEYDIHRVMKYPIIAYHQRKIAELNKY